MADFPNPQGSPARSALRLVRQEDGSFRAVTRAYTFTRARELLQSLAPQLRGGSIFRIRVAYTSNQTSFERFYTITPSTLERMMSMFDETFDEAEVDYHVRGGSDIDVFVNISIATEIEVEEITHSGRQYNRRRGGFFPYLHTIEDEFVSKELSKLGCFKEVETKNYMDNCLVHCFQFFKLPTPVIEDLRVSVRSRKVSRLSLNKLAEKYNLAIAMHVDGADHIVRIGDAEKATHAMEFGLYQGHYFPYYKTQINRYALMNYDTLKDKKNWWDFKDAKRRDASRGLNTMELLKAIVEHYSTPIDITTPAIMSTHYYDRFTKRPTFSTLEYPDPEGKVGAVRLKHPPREEGRSAIRMAEELSNVSERVNSDLAEWMRDEGFEVYRRHAPTQKLDHAHDTWNRAIRNIEKSEPLLSADDCESVSGVGEKVMAALREAPWDTFDTEKTEEGEKRKLSPLEQIRLMLDEWRESVQWYDPLPPNEYIERLKKKTEGYSTRETLKEMRKRNPLRDYFLVADFETCPFGKHREYAVCFESLFTDSIKGSFTGVNCSEAFVNYLVDTFGEVVEENPRIEKWDGRVVKIFMHNATYDFSFMFEHLHQLRTIERGTSIVVAEAMVYHKDRACKIKVYDSYKMIAMPLSDFGKSFQLDTQKEVMPYALYTHEFVERGGLATRRDLRPHREAMSFADRLRMNANIKAWGCERDDGLIDMIEYSRRYCELDVTVLKKGMLYFRESLLEYCQMDIVNYPTMASLSDAYFEHRGCFDGVYELSAVPRAFIAANCIGGRVMCADNKKQHVLATEDDPIEDFDGVSLYPSAMFRIPGYLKGKPKVWNAQVDLNSVDGYFVRIKVLDVREKYALPVTCLRTDDGNQWTNDLVGKELYVCKFTLEDLVKHHGITYEVIQGYYFDDGRNTLINECIDHLFKLRVQLKREKKASQSCLKLMMNASYGILGLKPPETDVQYDNDESNFWYNHADRIKVATPCGVDGRVRFELFNEIESHFNRQHIACEILAVSKNIMNEVTCLAEKIEPGSVVYTDTDSMHIRKRTIEKLQTEYKELYKRELVGEDMGQFHVDFDAGGTFMCKTVGGKRKLMPTNEVLEEPADPVDVDDYTRTELGVIKRRKVEGELHSIEMYALGKKCYIDRLYNDQGERMEMYHIRMKGVPNNAILHRVNEDFGGDPMAMYAEMFVGRKIKFDLLAGGKARFKTQKDHSMTTVQEMIREVGF